MSNTYLRLFVQFVFAVKYRKAKINVSWKNELYSYIAGVIKNNGHQVLAINGMPDHIHIFVSMNASESVSSLMKDVKGSSSRWINDRGFVTSRFEWQQGYGAFSYSRSAVNNVINYINNQEAHHNKKAFLEEYVNLLEIFGVEYDPQYIFKEME